MTDEQSPPETKPKGMAQRIIIILVVAGILLALLAIAIPAFVKARNTACQEACIRNLRMIQGGR